MSLYRWTLAYRDRKQQYIDMGFPLHIAIERAHWDVNDWAEIKKPHGD